MESLKRLIDKAMRVCTTKTALASRLGVSQQRLQHWATGQRSMPDEAVIELARIAGVDQVRALGEYRWEWLTKKKAGAVASGAAWAFGVAAVGIAALLGPAGAQAREKPIGGVPTTHILRNVLSRLRGHCWNPSASLRGAT